MKVKMVIQTAAGDGSGIRQSEVWNGELEFDETKEYLMKVSIIGEGIPQPICDIPFALGVGHYQWVPPMPEEPLYGGGWSLQFNDPEEGASAY